MKGSALYLRVGLLVIVGAVLAAGFVLFLAGGRGGGPLTIFETYSRESVQGLDIGAPVRYRGVPIGRVTEIRLASAEYRRPEGVPFGEAFQLVLVRFSVDPSQIGEVPTMGEAIRLGLRARISAQGITGVNYVELDFVSPERFPVEPVPWTPRYPRIPSIPSTVAQVRGAAEAIVERLSNVPLEQMASDLSQLLAGLNRQVNDGDLANTLRAAGEIMQRVNRVLADGELQATLTDIRAAAAAARDIATAPELRSAVSNAAAASAELQRATQRLGPALTSLERTMRTARETTVDVQSELVPILTDLRAITASLRATTQQLRNSPSQTLFGAPPPAGRR